MPFLARRTEAQLRAVHDQEYQQREQQKLVLNLHSRRRIIKNKALEDLQGRHQALGYQSELVVQSRDIYSHALAIIERLADLPPEVIVTELHALHVDLGDYLLYTRAELAEFVEGDQARQNLQEAFCREQQTGTMLAAANSLEPVIHNALLTQEYLLECVNKPYSVLKILDRVHYCSRCRNIDSQRDLERGRLMDNPYENCQLKSELSQLALADDRAIRHLLPIKGATSCLAAETKLQTIPLPENLKQALLNNNETIYKAWLRLQDRQPDWPTYQPEGAK